MWKLIQIQQVVDFKTRCTLHFEDKHMPLSWAYQVVLGETIIIWLCGYKHWSNTEFYFDNLNDWGKRRNSENQALDHEVSTNDTRYAHFYGMRNVA